MEWLRTIPKKKKNVAWRVIEGEAVLMPSERQAVDRESLEVCNQTGTAIWEAIDGKSTAAEIIKRIIDDYEVNFTKAESDIKSFLGWLAKKDLIEWEEVSHENGKKEKAMD